MDVSSSKFTVIPNYSRRVLVPFSERDNMPVFGTKIGNLSRPVKRMWLSPEDMVKRYSRGYDRLENTPRTYKISRLFDPKSELSRSFQPGRSNEELEAYLKENNLQEDHSTDPISDDEESVSSEIAEDNSENSTGEKFGTGGKIAAGGVLHAASGIASAVAKSNAMVNTVPGAGMEGVGLGTKTEASTLQDKSIAAQKTASNIGVAAQVAETVGMIGLALL